MSEKTMPDIALSVRQPWAWAIIYGGKDIENRSAAAVRHGMTAKPIAIHAAKGMTRYEYESAQEFMEKIGVECPRPDDLVRSAVIGTVAVTAIVQAHNSRWFFGPRGLLLAGPIACDPIPASGALGYFRWKPGGHLAESLPWMKAWPDDHRRTLQPHTMPLFDPPQ